MDPARFRLKAFGLCLAAALSLMAFMAVSAQAEWRILNSPINVNQNIEITKHTAIELSVPAKSLKIKCEVLVSSNSFLIPTNNLLLVLAEPEFGTCKTFLSNSESPGCKPKEPITGKILGHLILHGSPAKNYVLLEPDPPATSLARIEYIAGCALMPTNVVGDAVVECLTEALGASDCATERVNQLFQEVAPGLFSDELKYGASPATISGIAKAKLKTTNVGCTWGGKI